MRADLVYQTVSLMDRLCLYTDVKTFHRIYDVLVGAFDVGYQEAIDDLDEDIEIEIVEESPLDQYRDEDLFEGRTEYDMDDEDDAGYVAGLAEDAYGRLV